MEKQIVTKEQAIEDFKEMFKMDNSKTSIYEDSSFMVDKQYFTREEVISKLVEYFDKYRIENHHVSICPITLVWTSFQIEPNDMHN